MPTNCTVQVTQRSHHFAFGSATRAAQLIGTDVDSQKYRQCFFDNFQWSVFHNAHKWRQMERHQVNILLIIHDRFLNYVYSQNPKK